MGGASDGTNVSQSFAKRHPLGVGQQLAGRRELDRLGDPQRDLGVEGQVVGLARLRGGRGHDDRLLGGVLADPVGAVAAAETRRLPSAHRKLQREVVDLGVVDAAGPGLDPAGDALATLGVSRPHRRREPVGHVVGEAHRLFGVGDPHHGKRRAEGLLGHAEHRVVDVGEDGRLVEAARPLPRAAPGHDARALVHRVGDVAGDHVHLRREGDRPDVDRPGPGRRALAKGLDALGEQREELVVDGLLDVDALDRDAGLARVAHPVGDGGVRGALEVGVGEHDHRVLAPELEADRRQGLGGAPHHLLAGLDRAREVDEVDLVDQRGAGLAAAR